jgi:hypothetical protein
MLPDCYLAYLRTFIKATSIDALKAIQNADIGPEPRPEICTKVDRDGLNFQGMELVSMRRGGQSALWQSH